jgi:hypothetical protein
MAGKCFPRLGTHNYEVRLGFVRFFENFLDASAESWQGRYANAVTQVTKRCDNQHGF